jgi:glucose/mannose transport system substrate-binding protein
VGGAERVSPWRLRTLPWLLGFSSLACNSSPESVRLEVYSWWREQPEAWAFDQVKNLHESLHPGVTVVNLGDANATEVRPHVAQISLAGAPPATFQANIGADLLRWTGVDTQGSDTRGPNRIYGLSRLFARPGLDLEKHLPEAVLGGLRVGDSLEPYAVPINIHRLNVLYYNESVLAEAGPPPGDHQSWLEPDLLCPGDPNAPPLPLRISLGANDLFTLTLLVFENLLPALSGADFYERLFQGNAESIADWKDQVRAALRCARYLGKSLLDVDTNWEGAVEDVKSGRATLTVMGDWASGQLKSELEHERVKAIPFPGSEGIYVYTSDSFPLPVGAEYTLEAEELLATIASPEAQRRFSEEKGSIPARDDVELSPRDRERRLDFDRSVKALATSGRFPPYYSQNDLNTKLLAMLRASAGDSEVEAVVEELVALSPLLRRFQARLSEGPASVPQP